MSDFVKGSRHFRTTYYAENRARYASLARAQSPDCLFITCSDSRILPSRISESGPGESFVIRNIANMVPPWDRAGEFLAVSSAIEYAVEVLEVKNIIVCGHSNCGGCKLLREGGADSLPLASAWVALSSDIREKSNRSEPTSEQQCERDNVLLQLKRLQEYPAIAQRCDQNRLSLHGWHYTIESGEIHQYDPGDDTFTLIN